MLAAWFGASLLLASAALLGLRAIGIVPDPESRDAQKVLDELTVRLVLLVFLGGTCVAILWDGSMRGWVLARRWRMLLLSLFALGSAAALADPFHPVTSEGNWVRYPTACALGVAGVLAIRHALRSAHPIPDRLFGGAFGSLLIAAALDEIFQFHEEASRIFAGSGLLPGTVKVGDQPTLLIAAAGVMVLCTLVLVRQYGGRVGRTLRRERYRLPLRLFTFSVITFFAAMLLDSFDLHLRDALLGAEIAGRPMLANDRLLLGVIDVPKLANTVEELLELLSAIGLLMLVGSLFGVEALGMGRDADPT